MKVILRYILISVFLLPVACRNVDSVSTPIKSNPEPMPHLHKVEIDAYGEVQNEVTELHDVEIDSTPERQSEVADLVKTRIKTPTGYTRTEEDAGSFQEYLRSLKLKPEGSKVKYYDGSTKPSSVYVAVVDLEIGTEDLHQCADAVMRLRAEYLWDNEHFDQIHFNFTNGHKVAYSEWVKGNRMNIQGNKTWWSPQAEPSNTYADFWEYMELIFMYAGTASLSKEMQRINIDDAQIGDVLIKGGFPGHAVIIIDKAIHEQTGEPIYLLAQSYMPAQETQVLANFTNSELHPWYQLESGPIYTAEWEFHSDQLKRFDQ